MLNSMWTTCHMSWDIHNREIASGGNRNGVWCCFTFDSNYMKIEYIEFDRSMVTFKSNPVIDSDSITLSNHIDDQHLLGLSHMILNSSNDVHREFLERVVLLGSRESIAAANSAAERVELELSIGAQNVWSVCVSFLSRHQSMQNESFAENNLLNFIVTDNEATEQIEIVSSYLYQLELASIEHAVDFDLLSICMIPSLRFSGWFSNDLSFETSAQVNAFWIETALVRAFLAQCECDKVDSKATVVIEADWTIVGSKDDTRCLFHVSKSFSITFKNKTFGVRSQIADQENAAGISVRRKLYIEPLTWCRFSETILQSERNASKMRLGMLHGLQILVMDFVEQRRAYRIIHHPTPA